MGLNDRKLKILEAIVNDYIQTAEPIGSRTIAKKSGLGLSSATIRNEMSDLEDMGFITQPHASSGRIPSEKGYRFYVDQMMHSRALTSEEAMFLQKMIIDNIYQLEYMMQETAKAIAQLTNYPAIVSEPYLKKTRIKHIQLIPLDEKSVVLVLVTDTKTLKNQVLALASAPAYEDLARMSHLLNTHLSGLTIPEINRPVVDSLLVAFGPQAHILMSVLGIVADMIQAEDDMRVYTSGVKNILAFPEFSDIRKAEAIFQALEERDILVSLLGQSATGEIQVLIGTENSLDFLKDCSLIKANYSIDNQSTGCIAVIGPTRMDYAQAVSVLQGILQNIQHVINALAV